MDGKILQVVMFSSIMYWMAQLHQSAERFFIFEAIIILNCLTAGSLYSLIGALSPNEVRLHGRGDRVAVAAVQ